MNVRCGLIVSLLLGGVGCSGDSYDTPDAQTAQPADPTPSACAAISDDLAPSASAGPLDGTYAYEEGQPPFAMRPCTVSDDGLKVYSFWAKLDHERLTMYRRVYPYAQGCGSDFDAGGQIEVVSDGVMRSCDQPYSTTDGTFRQAVFLSRLSNGDLFRSYKFYGEGPTNPKWKELIVSTLSSNNPFERAPGDLRFGHFRRPK